MKDYSQHLEKNKKRIKWITGVLVLALFGLLAVAFFGMYTKLENKLVTLQKENLHLIEWRAKADTLAHFKLAYENLSMTHDSLKLRYDTLSEKTWRFSEKTYNTLRRTFVQSMGQYQDGRAQLTLKDWVASNDTNQIKNIIHQLSKDKKAFEKIYNDLQIADDQYSISIIYMEGFGPQRNRASILLQADNKLVILKEEEMNKFTYDPMLRYFREEDQEQATRIKTSLESGMNIKLELQLVKLPAPERNMELWLGKKNIQKEKILLEEQIKLESRELKAL